MQYFCGISLVHCSKAHAWLWSETAQVLISHLEDQPTIKTMLEQLEQAVRKDNIAPTVAAERLIFHYKSQKYVYNRASEFNNGFSIMENTPSSDNLAALVKANENYADNFELSELTSAPTKHVAILTCMDCRMDPSQFVGLKEGEAHVIRNAGGRATEDAIRSLIISHKFLGTLEWFVIQHTQCGMSSMNDKQIAELLAQDLETAVFRQGQWQNPQRQQSDNTKPGSELGKTIDWYTFTDLKASVLGDIDKIKNHPLVPSHIKIYGFIYDVKTGGLTPVSQWDG